MKEKIKQEATQAMALISMLNVNGEAVDVVATICDATEQTESEGEDETA